MRSPITISTSPPTESEYEYRTATLSPSPVPSPQPSDFPGRNYFYTVKNGRHIKTFTLEAITGLPEDGYITIVWDSNERPAPERLLSWLHFNPPNVRKTTHAPSQLEGMIANKKFRAEALLLRAEMKQEMSWMGPYWDRNEEKTEYDFELARSGEKGQRVAAWVDAVEEASGWGKREGKRGRAEMEKEAEQPSSPPTKRAKLEFPCVVPGCGKGYKSTASLQRHVFSGHERVDDPVARRACRLLWGRRSRGSRRGEINRRYGGY
jgi:hypothetical protein